MREMCKIKDHTCYGHDSGLILVSKGLEEGCAHVRRNKINRVDYVGAIFLACIRQASRCSPPVL